MPNSTPSLRTLLEPPGLLVIPGAQDAVAARVIEAAGFEAVYMTGYGVSASRVGVPDVGLAGLGEMLDGLRALRRAVSLPICADADTGFGGPLNVRRTVREYEAAGASAIQIEDQLHPKRCGHTLGRALAPPREMVHRIEVALEARGSDDLLVIARTDARTSLGLDEALERARLYAEAGADLLFVESPETEDEMKRIAGELPRPTVVNLVEGGRTPLLTHARLAELGFKVALHPVTALLAGIRATREALATLREHGDPAAASSALESFEDASTLLGFPEADAFAKRHR
jgi:2-methylisocitrate lyase-like PEP mutase family enzyme